MTRRSVPIMLRPAAKAMNWGPFAVATAVGIVILIVPAVVADRLNAATITTLLRITAACGALGVAFLLDDPAIRTISTVPTSRLVRQAVRAALTLPVAAAGWGAALAISSLGVEAAVSAAVPRAALTLEAAAMVAVALGLAASGLRITAEGNAGILAAPTLMFVLTMMWFIPRRAALILPPADPQWAAAHLRWAGLLVVAVVLFIWASYETAPGRRSTRPRRRRRGDATLTSADCNRSSASACAPASR